MYPLVSHRAWELQGKVDVLKLDWNEATVPKENILNFLEDGNNSLLLEELSKYNILQVLILYMSIL